MAVLHSDHLRTWLWRRDRFPRPDWEVIGRHICTNCDESQWHDAWIEAARGWLDETRKQLPEGYRIEESENFLFFCSLTASVGRRLMQAAEQSLSLIADTLGTAAGAEVRGKHVILCFADQADAVSYLDYYHANREGGHYMLPGGMFLPCGYPHTVLLFTNNTAYAVRTIAHELTHLCVCHLPLPAWLNEGIATNMEERMAEDAYGSKLYMDRELKERHLAFWNADTIQRFWSGESFGGADEACELSYSMAAMLILQIAETFKQLPRIPS